MPGTMLVLEHEREQPNWPYILLGETEKNIYIYIWKKKREKDMKREKERKNTNKEMIYCEKCYKKTKGWYYNYHRCQDTLDRSILVKVLQRNRRELKER